MAAPMNTSLNHQGECTICLEDLAVRTTVTLRCRHTFHLDCLGSAFNAGNEMRCPVCRALEEGVWRTFPPRAPRSSRAAANSNQENVQEPPVRLQRQAGISWYLDQGWFSGSLSLGNGGPIRHPSVSERRRRETTHMRMGTVNGSSRVSRSSRVTRITRLHLDINRRPEYGYSVQGNVGPNEHYDPFPQGMNSVQHAGLEAPDIAYEHVRLGAPDVVYQSVRLEAPDVAYLGEPISYNSASAGSLFGPLAAEAPVRQSLNSPSPAVQASAGSLFGSSSGAAPVQHSMNSPSPAVRAMIRAANDHYSSHGLLPAEQMTSEAEGSGAVNIQLPTLGEVLLGLSTGVQPEDGTDSSEDILSDDHVSVEDPSE